MENDSVRWQTCATFTEMASNNVTIDLKKGQNWLEPIMIFGIGRSSTC